MNIIDTKLRGRVVANVFAEWIEKENNRQVDKWGIQDRHIFEWSMWTNEEFGEFNKAINEYAYGRAGSENIIKEGIQTVTLILKILDGIITAESKEE